MKNWTIIAVLTIFIFSSCSSSKEARTYKKAIDGSWQLQTIVTEGISGRIKAQIFNEQDFNCFVGSTWNFNSNNSLGSYNISKNGNECVAIKRDIRWSIFEAPNEPKLLQFKRLDSKLKQIDEGGGFRFTILQADDKTMKLRSDISFEGKPASFIYNFVRN
jgi:hypothetical protein